MVDTTTPINPVNPINTITPTNPKIPTDQSVCNPLVKISSAIWSPNMEFVVDEVGDFVYSADDFVYDDGLEYDGRKSETDYSETKLYRDICFAFRYDNCDNFIRLDFVHFLA